MLESNISLSQFEKLARRKVFKSCLNDLNFYSNKLLVFFAISHPACQPYEQRIYFLFQAVLLSRWAVDNEGRTVLTVGPAEGSECSWEGWGPEISQRTVSLDPSGDTYVGRNGGRGES